MSPNINSLLGLLSKIVSVAVEHQSGLYNEFVSGLVFIPWKQLQHLVTKKLIINA